MKIYVMRHGEVDYTWKERYTSEEFDRACAEYDESPVKDGRLVALPDDCRIVYCSTLSRSKATARKLLSGRKLKISRLINEVPLRSSFDTERKLPLRFWETTGRLQWFWNFKRQPEGRRATRKRAGKLIRLLCREGADCAVVTHGFYMLTLLQELKRAGFRTGSSRANYRNGEIVVAER